MVFFATPPKLGNFFKDILLVQRQDRDILLVHLEISYTIVTQIIFQKVYYYYNEFSKSAFSNNKECNGDQISYNNKAMRNYSIYIEIIK